MIKSIGSVVVSILLFLLVGGWVILVATKIGTQPTLNKDGSIQVDEFAQAKDILVILFPLLTTAVGFWLGNQGTVAAQKQTTVANATASRAQDNAHKAGVREKLAYAASNDPALLTKAMDLAKQGGVDLF